MYVPRTRNSNPDVARWRFPGFVFNNLRQFLKRLVVSLRKAEVLAFDIIAFFKKLGDIPPVKLHRSRFPGTRYSGSENAGSCRWRRVGAASAAGICIRH